MPRFKFSDEELSRILSESAVGGLRSTLLSLAKGRACINMVAWNESDAYAAAFPKGIESEKHPAAAWFDRGGVGVAGDPDALLAGMEKAGLA